jgi:hypothetical protein
MYFIIFAFFIQQHFEEYFMCVYQNAIIFVSLLVEVFQLSTFAIQQLAPVVVASNTTAFNLSSVSAPHSAALMFHDSRIVPVVFQTLSNSTAASSASWGSDIGLVISALYLDFTRLSPATIFTAQTWIAVGLVGLLLLLCIIQALFSFNLISLI